uniref:Uncharacterized protein n=1 Tax=Micrurus surinamensis TaxID=129470 RepID=A0A2D4PFK0_MICSU
MESECLGLCKAMKRETSQMHKPKGSHFLQSTSSGCIHRKAFKDALGQGSPTFKTCGLQFPEFLSQLCFRMSAWVYTHADIPSGMITSKAVLDSHSPICEGSQGQFSNSP